MHKLFIPKRVKEVKKILKEENQSDLGRFEGVYRCYHGSFKIMYIKSSAVNYFKMSLYILGLIDKCQMSFSAYDDPKHPLRMENLLDKYVIKDTLTYNIATDLLNCHFPKSKGWVHIYDQIIPYCGFYYFFKTVLESLIKYAEEKTGDEHGLMDFFEGTARYFIRSLKTEDTNEENK